jgi:hypothetical protein
MSSEFRRRKRRRVDAPILVTDVMRGSAVGRIANLSETGMLLVATVPLREDALYQFRFTLPEDDTNEAMTYETGAHLLWADEHGSAGTTWAGFRFIAVPEDQVLRLRAWIEADATAE